MKWWGGSRRGCHDSCMTFAIVNRIADHISGIYGPAGDVTQSPDEILNALNTTVKSEPQPDTLPPGPAPEYDILNKQLIENPRNPE